MSKKHIRVRAVNPQAPLLPWSSDFALSALAVSVTVSSMFSRPLEKSFPTVAAVSDRRNAEENNGSTLRERCYKAFFNGLSPMRTFLPRVSALLLMLAALAGCASPDPCPPTRLDALAEYYEKQGMTPYDARWRAARDLHSEDRPFYRQKADEFSKEINYEEIKRLEKGEQ